MWGPDDGFRSFNSYSHEVLICPGEDWTPPAELVEPCWIVFLIGSGEKEEFPPLYQHTFQKMVTVGQSHHMRQIWADGIMGFMHPKIFQRLQLDLKPYRSPRIHRVDFRHHPLLFLAGSSFKFPSHPMKTTDKLRS